LFLISVACTDHTQGTSEMSLTIIIIIVVVVVVIIIDDAAMG
jgi:hypothetical protein